MKVEYVPTERQAANIFTKEITQVSKWQIARAMLGIVAPLQSPNRPVSEGGSAGEPSQASAKKTEVTKVQKR